MGYCISGSDQDGSTMYVCAPAGYMRSADGKLIRDGSQDIEWTYNREHAHKFKSHRAAAIARNKSVGDNEKKYPIFEAKL